MSRHNHSHCMHDLKYCDHCDVVYCTKCDREWGGHVHYQPYTWYYGGMPYQVTWGNTGYEITCYTGEKVTDPQIISAYNLQAQTSELGEGTAKWWHEDTVKDGVVTCCTHHN